MLTQICRHMASLGHIELNKFLNRQWEQIRSWDKLFISVSSGLDKQIHLPWKKK